MRFARMSTIFALPCAVSVTIPACEPGERDRLVAEVVDRHRAQRARDALADRDQHVQLAGLGARRDLVCEPDELVGRVAHRGEHGDDSVPCLAGGDEPLGDRSQAVDVRDRRPAELHHDGAGARSRRLLCEGRESLVVRRRHAGILGHISRRPESAARE